VTVQLDPLLLFGSGGPASGRVMHIPCEDGSVAFPSTWAFGASEHVPMTEAARDVFERGTTCGFADENLTAVIKLYATKA
jgi:hypothetical protein